MTCDLFCCDEYDSCEYDCFSIACYKKDCNFCRRAGRDCPEGVGMDEEDEPEQGRG